jgi:alkylation response protein AidB-like acyl-CoA dehydrogenase
VDFRVDADQQALKDGVRSFCEGRIGLDTLRALEATGGFDASLWKELAELGVFALRSPEDRGGAGLGMAEAVLVFEELGRALVPGPLLWSQLAAGLVPGAADGDVVVGGLDLAGAAGEPYLVEHWEALDVLLVLWRDRVERIDPARLSVSPVATPLDPLTPLHHVLELPAGEALGGADVARSLRLAGAALASGQLLGIAEGSLELALDYAKKREQFGRVIGSFQALKHMLADMFARQELARAGVYAAGATLDQPEVGNVERAVSTGKLMASEAAMKNARACIQIHGGMGYTWEVPAHYFYKRTWVLESQLGTSDEAALRVGDSFDATL